MDSSIDPGPAFVCAQSQSSHPKSEPPILSSAFVTRYSGLPTELQLHIIQQLFTGLQPPKKAEQGFLMDDYAIGIFNMGGGASDADSPSMDHRIELARALDAFRHLAVLGSSAAVPLANFRARW